MPETILFAAALMGLSATLVVIHLRAWRKRDHGGLTDEDYLFFRGQFQRRLLTSGLIGVIGLAMLGHFWTLDLRSATILWLGVLSLVGGVLLLALLDWLASRRFVQRHLVEHAQLRQRLLAEAKELRERHRREGMK